MIGARVTTGWTPERGETWRQEAACAVNGWPVDWWTSSDVTERGHAVWICQHECPVRAECAAWAHANLGRCEQAVYGGVYYCRAAGQTLTGPVRRSGIQPVPARPGRGRTQRRHRSTAECGTPAGYQRHNREATDPCGPCRAANADITRRRAQANRDPHQARQQLAADLAAEQRGDIDTGRHNLLTEVVAERWPGGGP